MLDTGLCLNTITSSARVYDRQNGLIDLCPEVYKMGPYRVCPRFRLMKKYDYFSDIFDNF